MADRRRRKCRRSAGARSSQCRCGIPASGEPPQPPTTSDVRRYFSSRSLRAAAWFAAGVICASGVVLLMVPRKAVPTPSVIRAQIAPGVQLSEASPFAVSPDGQQLVFGGTGSDGVNRLWVRRMDAEVARPLSGTEAALGGLTPPMFWSPDSQSVAFAGVGELKRIDVRGGAPRTVCNLPNGAIGGSWNADDVIVVGQPAGGLLRCPAAGGAVSEVTRLDATKGESRASLTVLPAGRPTLPVPQRLEDGAGKIRRVPRLSRRGAGCPTAGSTARHGIWRSIRPQRGGFDGPRRVSSGPDPLRTGIRRTVASASWRARIARSTLSDRSWMVASSRCRRMT